MPTPKCDVTLPATRPCHISQTKPKSIPASIVLQAVGRRVEDRRVCAGPDQTTSKQSLGKPREPLACHAIAGLMKHLCFADPLLTESRKVAPADTSIRFGDALHAQPIWLPAHASRAQQDHLANIHVIPRPNALRIAIARHHAFIFPWLGAWLPPWLDAWHLPLIF